MLGQVDVNWKDILIHGCMDVKKKWEDRLNYECINGCINGWMFR